MTRTVIRHQVKATQVFNGTFVRETIHDVATVTGRTDSVEALVQRYESTGPGWGHRLSVATPAEAAALGAYESDVSGYWWLPLPNRDPVPLSIERTSDAP